MRSFFWALLALLAKAADITTWAPLPPVPGYPEGILVHDTLVYVSGPAQDVTAGTGRSAIYVFNRVTKRLVSTIWVKGENLKKDHALSNIAVDSAGRIYALSTQLGLLRFRKVGLGPAYQQQVYGKVLPKLPSTPLPPLPNDIVFDSAGNAYVSDSFQGAIFKYKNGGGVAQVWFQSEKLVGTAQLPFGVNGIRLNPERTHMYIAVTNSADAPFGAIYRLPFQSSPTQDQLEVFFQYPAPQPLAPPAFPDQLAFGSDGSLYVSLAGESSISVLGTNSQEILRYRDAADIKLDSPAGICFDSVSKSLLIANHASVSKNVTSFAVLQANIDKTGDPLELPTIN